MKEVEWVGGLENEFDDTTPAKPEAHDTLDRLYDLAEWLVSMDDDDPESPGRKERQTITLTKIIERAREALA